MNSATRSACLYGLLQFLHSLLLSFRRASVPSSLFSGCGRRTKYRFRYDYMSRRVRKDVLQWNGSLWQTNEIRTFSYDGWNLLCEVGRGVPAEPSFTNYYTWGLDLSGSLQGAGGIGGLVSAQLLNPATSNSTTVFYTFDGNGNVSECLTPAGETAAHYCFSPVGTLVASEGSFAEINPWQFSTRYFDIETGIGKWPHRDYHAAINRWGSRDPMDEEFGQNLYAFVRNGLVNRIDPLGFWDWPWEGCCAGQKYNRFKQCCCCDGKKEWYGWVGCKLLDKEPEFTGVVVYETTGGEKDPGNYHQWVAWPSCDGGPGSCGFNPPGYPNKLKCPDPNEAARRGLPIWDRQYNAFNTIKLDPCEYDIAALIRCLDSFAGAPQTPRAGSNCRSFASDLVNKCIIAAGGKCTMSKCGGK